MYDNDSEEDVLSRFRAVKCCDFLWIFFWRAFELFALTLVAMLSEPDEDSQSLEAWLLRFIEFMSIGCDSLTSLLLSALSISWSKAWIEVEDVSSVISCCASGTDKGWSWFYIIPSWICGIAIIQRWSRFIIMHVGIGCVGDGFTLIHAIEQPLKMIMIILILKKLWMWTQPQSGYRRGTSICHGSDPCIVWNHSIR